MKDLNLANVEESTFDSLPVGGYVVRITDVEDVPYNPGTQKGDYLKITYDIAESYIGGRITNQYSGHFSDDWGRKNPWAHRFIRSYKEAAIGMFKAFANRVEESNRGFSWNQTDEKQLIGKEVGVVLQKRLYTNDKGDDREALEAVGVCASQDVRSGDFKIPEPRDMRAKVAASASSSVSDDDLPF